MIIRLQQKNKIGKCDIHSIYIFKHIAESNLLMLKLIVLILILLILGWTGGLTIIDCLTWIFKRLCYICIKIWGHLLYSGRKNNGLQNNCLRSVDLALWRIIPCHRNFILIERQKKLGPRQKHSPLLIPCRPLELLSASLPSYNIWKKKKRWKFIFFLQ